MLIVDAFNVLHAAPQADPRLAGLTLDGLAKLIASGRHGSLECVLVCDGTGGGMARGVDPSGVLGSVVRQGGGRGGGGVRMWFAGPGRDADSAIEGLLDEQERKRAAHRCTVVSSDKRLKSAAAGARAKWMSSQALVKQLVQDAARAKAREVDRTGGKPAIVNEGLDPDSTAYWMRTFGYGPPGAGGPRPAAPRVAPTVTPTKPVSPAAPVPPKAQAQSRRPPEPLWQEWGAWIDPDDLDMEKWIKGVTPRRGGRS